MNKPPRPRRITGAPVGFEGEAIGRIEHGGSGFGWFGLAVNSEARPLAGSINQRSPVLELVRII